MNRRLLLELRKDATESKVPVSDLLRKALVLAENFEIGDVPPWINHELSGYVAGNPIPIYRHLHGQLTVDNPYHGLQPVLVHNTQMAKILATRPVFQSISQLENLLRSEDGGALTMPFTPEVERSLMQMASLPFRPLYLIDRSQIHGVLDGVRNAVLSWALQLDKRQMPGARTTSSRGTKKKDKSQVDAAGNKMSPEINSAAPVKRDKLFVSYSHKDKKFFEQLLAHLKPLERAGRVTPWSDKKIQPGSKWLKEIEKALAETKVAVLLVTKDFLASDFIHEHELSPLLKDAAAGGVEIRWVLVRNCNWSETPLKDYQAAYPTDKPLAEMKAERDTAWVKICKTLKGAANSVEPADDVVPTPTPPIIKKRKPIVIIRTKLGGFKDYLSRKIGEANKIKSGINLGNRPAQIELTRVWIAEVSKGITTALGGQARNTFVNYGPFTGQQMYGEKMGGLDKAIDTHVEYLECLKGSVTSDKLLPSFEVADLDE